MQKEKLAVAKNTRQKRLESTPIIKLLEKIYLNEREAAALTGKSVCSLRNDRHLKRGLSYLRVGKSSVMYKTQDIIDFMEARPVSLGGE